MNRGIGKLLAVVALSVFVPACGSADVPEARLLESVDEYDEDYELDRLRRMMAVRLVGDDGSVRELGIDVPDVYYDALWPNDDAIPVLEDDESGFYRMVVSQCKRKTYLEPNCSADCCTLRYMINWRLCVADHFLAAATAAEPSTSYEVRDGPDDYVQFDVGAQSHATSAALAQAAYDQYSLSLRMLVGVLSSFPVQDYGWDNDHSDDVTRHCPYEDMSQSRAGWAASTLVDAFRRAKESAEVAVNATVAVSDSQWGSTPALSLAAARVQSGQFLSRAAAAHLMVGGDPGLKSVVSEALCDRDRLTGEAKAALRILREAGSPWVLDYDIDHALNGGSSLPAGLGSVRDYLEQRWGVEFTTDGSGVKRTVQDELGLSTEAFQEAAIYLWQEYEAFDRTTSFLPAELGQHPRAAAIASPPARMNDAFWVNLTRSAVSPAYRSETGAGDFPILSHMQQASPPVAGLIDWVHSAAAHILQRSEILNDSELNGAIAPVVGTLALAHERPVRITQCSSGSQNDGYGTVRVLVSPGGENSVRQEMILVEGADGLRCGTTSTVEGAPCEIEDYRVGEFDVTDVEHSGFVKEYITSAPLEEGETYYVLAPRTEHWEILEPGSYDVVGGLRATHWGSATLSEPRCQDFPVVPQLDRRVAEILQPSREWCVEPEVSCAGGQFDMRMPLENELADDGDLVESSWRHYLALAKQAAAESDLLANEYLDFGLRVDENEQAEDLRARAQEEKAMANLDRIQAICGTSADPASLIGALGGDALEQVAGGTCTSADPEGDDVCLIPHGQSSGRLIKDWTKVAEDDDRLVQVKDCLNAFTDETEPFVHLGDGALCLWEDGGELCGGEDDLRPCPVVATAEENVGLGDCPVPAGTTATAVLDDGLGLFSVADTLPPPPPSTLGNAVRELVAGVDGVAPQAVKTTYFAPGSLIELRKALSLEIHYGGYVSLKVNGEVIGSTGSSRYGSLEPVDPGTQNPASWPCGTAGRPTNCNETGDNSLLCQTWNCRDLQQRDEANWRLMRAVAVAQAITWASGEDPPRLPMPHYLLSGINPSPATPTPIWVWNGYGAEEIQIERRTNDRWTAFYYPTLAGGELFNEAFRLQEPGGSLQEWFLTGDDRAFAIREIGGWFPGGAPSLEAFWRGLSDALPGTGLVLQVLAGNVGQDPELAKSVHFHSTWDTYGINKAGNRKKELRERGLSLKSDKADVWSSGELNFTLTPEAVRDAVELLAEAVQRSDQGQWCDPNTPPDVASVQDLGATSAFVSCMGTRIQHHAATRVFTDFPKAALDPLRAEGNGVLDTQPGELGQAYSLLRSALMRLSESELGIGQTLNDFGADLKLVENELRLYDIDDEISQWQFWSQVTNQMVACTQSLLGIEDKLTGQTVVTCANSAAQIAFASKIRQLESQRADVQRDISTDEFERRFGDHVTALETYELAVKESLEEITRQLGAIASLRQEAVRSMDQTIWHLSYQAKNEAEIATALTKRKETSRVRYVRAHENAQRMAFLAKRAIEQRLGVHLSEMRDDLPLVVAPSTWHSAVCSTSPLDYEAIRDPEADAPQSFADSYIGEYVRKLENVVESYRLENDFHEGSDTAVVSLRDDILGVRAPCGIESRNLLVSASRLEGAKPEAPALEAEAEEGPRGWTVRAPVLPGDDQGCALGETDEEGNVSILSNCVRVDVLDATDGTTGSRSRMLTFGDGEDCVDPTTCGWRPGAEIYQEVAVEPGRYIYSWYGDNHPGFWLGRIDGFDICTFGEGSGSDVIRHVDHGSPPSGWGRNYVTFDVLQEATISVGFGRPRCFQQYGSGSGASYTPFPWSGTVAAPMLERLDSTAADNMPPAGIFQDTDEEGLTRAAVCEDTDGSTFRERYWTANVQKLCPDGYSSDCRERAVEEAYRQIDFYVNQRGIDEGTFFQQSGFARWNFNYRIEEIAVNFVGTGIRDCEDSDLPTTCYAAGFVPYTLVHDGPYYVRNHRGDDFQAHLFRGRIEHARGLATERYVSNPIGSADQDLLQQYMRSELRGRPLDGNFTLRVWDADGVDFDAIEDVQLIIKYRYWTRFD